ncbi:Dipeptidyl aminopeptidase BIII [Halomonadaceae bacterium LMG 33818]|uniref:S9 family peptidase n=1 Tax=Cernens ardua TaxID=3402176 RepID=UPI003EDC61B4
MPSIDDIPLISRDVLFGPAERTNIKISPDGRYFSWIADNKGTANIWLAPTDSPHDIRPVTHDIQRGIKRYVWTYQPDVLLYYQDQGGDENYQLYALDLATKKVIDLTPFKKTQAQLVGRSHRHPEYVIIAMNDRDPKFHDLYSVNITTGERFLLEENTQGFMSYLVDEELAPAIAFSMTDDGGMRWLKKNSEEWSRLLDISAEDSLTTFPLIKQVKKNYLYIADTRKHDTAELTCLNIATGESTTLYSDQHSDIQKAIGATDKGEIKAVYTNYLKGEWHALEPDYKTSFEQLDKAFPSGFGIDSRTLDDQRWIVHDNAIDSPGNYYLFDRETRALSLICVSRPKLVDAPLVPMWPLEIPSRDGLTLVSYLTLPAHSDPDKTGHPITPQPLILFVHGGPWSRDIMDYHPMIQSWVQWIANRGYAVLQVNFRGSTGFGKKFINAANREWGGRMHDDLIDAIDWAIEQGITTHNKVGIFGGSYGGYATLVGMTFTPDRFACGIDLVGPSSLLTFIDTIPEYWKTEMDFFRYRVGDMRTEDGREFLWSRSPLSKVKNIKNPLLIAQGANDPRIKQSESDQLVAAMKENHIPVIYELFPDEGHGFQRPENNKAFFATVEPFLAKYLGGRVEPIGNDLEGSSLEVVVGAEYISGLNIALENFTPVIKH